MSAPGDLPPDCPRELGERVLRHNQLVLARREESWPDLSLSVVRYRRVAESSVVATNDGLLVCFAPHGDPGVRPPRINGRRQPDRRIAPGTIHLIPPGGLLEGSSDPGGGPVTYLNLVFPRTLVDAFAEEAGVGRELRPDFHLQDPTLALLLKRLMRSVGEADTSRLFRESASRFLLGMIYQSAAPPRRTRSQGGLSPWQQRRVTDHLREHFMRDIGIEELAGLAGLSPFHFARAFKTSLGAPPHAYLRRLRAERARVLIEEGADSVTAIAAEVGYESSQALARMFRREFGCSPSEHRRQHRGD